MTMSDDLDAAFSVQLPHWEPVPGDFVGEVHCLRKISDDGAEIAAYCGRPATRRRKCGTCDGYRFACDDHAVNDLTDIDIARLKKQVMPQLIAYAQRAADIERAARSAEAQRRVAFDELTSGIHRALLGFVGAERIERKINEVVQLSHDRISIVVDGKEVLAFPRGFLPGETALDLVRPLCRVAVEILAGAANGVSYGVERIREEHRPTVLVQCDDFGPAEDEHHKLVSKCVQIGTAAELAALNEALRMCARPARAFRVGDHLESYVTDDEHDHDHGAS